MRKLIARSIFAALAIGVFASTASALPIPIGYVTWLGTADPDFGQFSVVNQTGANVQPDDFPVVTQLLFGFDLNLAVDKSAGGTDNLGIVDMSSPDGGLSWDTAFYGIGVPVKATLTGTVTPVLGVALSTGGLWNIVGGITDALGNPIVLGDGSGPLVDGDFAVLYVDAVRAAVPEPATLLLIGVGVLGFAARRRVLAKG